MALTRRTPFAPLVGSASRSLANSIWSGLPRNNMADTEGPTACIVDAAATLPHPAGDGYTPPTDTPTAGEDKDLPMEDADKELTAEEEV